MFMFRSSYLGLGILLLVFAGSLWLLRDAKGINVIPGEKLAKKFHVSRTDLQSLEWKAAIDDATQHRRGMGSYSLLRVKTVGFDSPEEVQLKSTKLKELTRFDNGGGGLYRECLNGQFVLWEHLGKRGRNSIEIGHLRSGSVTLWFEIPKENDLNVIGDIIIRPALSNQHGRLQISIEKPAAINASGVVIGPLVVGGPYGTKYPLTADGKSKPIRLPNGTYKLLFSDFNIEKSRWDVTIRPGTTTRLELRAIDQTQLERLSETYEAMIEPVVENAL